MTKEPFKLNEVDAARPLAQLIQLRDTALQLGFQDEVEHWRKVISARKAQEERKS